MTKKETSEERKERFKAMTSADRKALIREKMKAEGLEEGSGVKGAIYDDDEVLGLIQVTSCFPELQQKRAVKNDKPF